MRTSGRLLFEEAAFYADTGVQWFNAALADGTLDAFVTQIAADPGRVPVYARPLLYRDRVAGGAVRREAEAAETALIDAASKVGGQARRSGLLRPARSAKTALTPTTTTLGAAEKRSPN